MLSTHLSQLDPAALAKILKLRPDAGAEPRPTHLGQLAAALSRPSSVHAARLRLDWDCLVVAQAMTLLGHGAHRDDLLALLGADPDRLDATLDRLASWALAWPIGGDRWDIPASLMAEFDAPLGLGRPAAELVANPELVEPTEIRKAAARLEGPAAEVLPLLLSEGPGAMLPVDEPLHPLTDLIESGLLLPTGDGAGELPREVGLALRDIAQEFPLAGPPDIPGELVKPADIARSAAAAAARTVGLVNALLDSAGQTPITELRAGGVGAREQKRLAKVLGCREPELPLLIDIVFEAALLGQDEGTLVPTELYDRWRDKQPAQRWIDLVQAWLRLPHAPSYRVIDSGETIPPPVPLASGSGELRRAMLTMFGTLPPDRAHRFENVVAATSWYQPQVSYPYEEVVRHIVAALAEGESLGLFALDALSELGRALAAGDDATLSLAAGRALSADQQVIALQSDLTAIVAGEPASGVTTLLDLAADPETRGTARTWRFSPDSVRRAFDSGMTAEQLLADLSALAPQGVPQPLEYLVGDVARRHGAVRAANAGCCVYGDDVAQITEMLHTKALKALKLRQIAPTVLISAKALAPTLEQLRAAGFAPIGEDLRGGEVRGSRKSARVDSRYVSALLDSGRRPVDPAELARQLLAEPVGEETLQLDVYSEQVRMMRQLAPELTPMQLAMLSEVIDNGGSARIEYVDLQGEPGSRTIEGAMLQPPLVYVWSASHRDPAGFHLNQLTGVDLL